MQLQGNRSELIQTPFDKLEENVYIYVVSSSISSAARRPVRFHSTAELRSVDLSIVQLDVCEWGSLQETIVVTI